MEHITREQVYHILQNLSNVEISYTEYSRTRLDYKKYQTYFDYFNNQVLRSHNLGRFYFPIPLTGDMKTPKTVTEWNIISEKLTILPGFDMAVSKMFNFPDSTRHCCDYYTMIYLMDGSGRLSLDDTQFDLEPGDFYLIPAGVYYGASSAPESVCIYFDLRRSFLGAEYKSIFQDDSRLNDFFVESLKNDSSMTYLAIHTNNSASIRNRVLDIFAEYINQEKFCSSAMKNHLALLMTSILRDPDTQIDSSISVSHIEQRYLLVREYLRHNYQSASLDEIAEELHFSKQYICKIVKTVSGRTFQTLLMEIRLQMATDYLRDTALPIESIAELCGFSTAAHLSRCFKNAHGIPPSVYRAGRS